MSKQLLEMQNQWQIIRAGILEKNSDTSMKMVINECDRMIVSAISSACNIAHRVSWDFFEAKRIVDELVSKENADG